MTARRSLSLLALGSFGASVALLVATQGGAVGTQTITLATERELSAGVLDRVSVTADGTVVLGAEVARVALPDAVGSVWSLAELPDGSVLAGTGVDGRVYRVQGERATLFSDTGAVAVTSLAVTDDGTVYAGTLPEGKLFRLVAPANGRAQPPVLVASLPGVEHIWSVAWDRARRAVLCATGPDGKLFAVDARGNATVVFDSDEPHLYAMALRADGTVFLGAGGDHAVLYALRGTGPARALARLAGDEVKAIALSGDEVFVAANEFPDPPAPPTRPSTVGRSVRPGGNTAPRPRPGRGRVYRVRADGLTELVYDNADAHVTALERDATRSETFASLGTNGRVVAIADDRTTRVAFDLDEHQVLSLHLVGRTPLLGTADAGALYRVATSRPTGATWNSRVLDGNTLARWGTVRWRGEGSFEWESRSGNSDAPDATWSAWEAVGTEGGLSSPRARYLQVRARFRDPSARLRAVTVYYLPENRRAVLTEVAVTPPETKAGVARSDAIKLGWKVDNPDADTLRYRLRFRGDADRTWRPLLRNQEWVTATDYTWPTEGLPEGYYRVEVEASDEESNPDDVVTRDRRVSAPILVDNTPPTVTVRVAGGRITGSAEDGASAVTRAELSVDGGEWRPVRARDGVLDGRREELDAPLPALSPGEHVVSLRAWDEARNLGTTSLTLRTR